MNSSIILMGPGRAGKSTLGKLLAEQLGRPFCPLGPLNGTYFQEKGFDDTVIRRLWNEQGFEACYHYLKPFQAYALERGLAAHPDAIVELDAEQSVYEDKALFDQVQQVLTPYPYIVLVLPSPDPDTSVRVLKERQRVMVDGMEINEHFVRHHSNYDLAKLTVYTKGKTPEETRDEILARIDHAQETVILIGPIGAGKSTIGGLLAKSLQLPEIELDKLRWDYYKEIGWDPEIQRQIGETEGFAGVYRYWKQFEIHAVERVLADHPDGVIHFGAGHSVYEDAGYFARAEACLRPYANVVLLLPSPDLDESVALFGARTGNTVDGVEVVRHLITHHSSHDLAKLTVYTEGKTPEQTRDEIVRHFARDP